VVVPGSNLYHGQQQSKLRAISEYAISKHNMHVVIGLHSLPGGVNGLEIGEAFGHANWWYNSTNLDYSLQAATAVLDFIKATANPSMYTIEPINEPGDTGLAHFGSTTTVSYPDGVNWLNSYLKAVYALIKQKGMSTTLMVADAFMGAS
jgi:glucan 1,3-beta-glucosidase